MYGGRGTSPYFATVAPASSAPTKRTRRKPPPRTSTISTALSSPNVTRRPGLSLPPGCPIASHVPSVSERTSRISVVFPDSRFPWSLAGITRDVLSTSTSPTGIRSAMSLNCRCVMVPVARSSTSKRLAARSGRGSWAMRSAGRSYSKSEARSGIENRWLLGALGWCETEVAVGRGRGAAAARRTREEALLHQEGLVHLLERARILADRRGDRLHADRPALEHLDDRLEDARVHVVETELVDVEPLERLDGDRRGDLAAGAARDLRDARRVGGDSQDSRRAGDDLDKVVGRVIVQPLDEAEAGAHRR